MITTCSVAGVGEPDAGLAVCEVEIDMARYYRKETADWGGGVTAGSEPRYKSQMKHQTLQYRSAQGEWRHPSGAQGRGRRSRGVALPVGLASGSRCLRHAALSCDVDLGAKCPARERLARLFIPSHATASPTAASLPRCRPAREGPGCLGRGLSRHVSLRWRGARPRGAAGDERRRRRASRSSMTSMSPRLSRCWSR